jgi:hypothetical protein
VPDEVSESAGIPEYFTGNVALVLAVGNSGRESSSFACAHHASRTRRAGPNAKPGLSQRRTQPGQHPCSRAHLLAHSS